MMEQSRQKNQNGFTLVELAIVLVVIGLLIGAGASLIGPLTKRAKLIENREIVKAAYEAVLGFAAGNKRLPTASEFTALGVKTSDTYGNPLQYARVPLTNICTSTGAFLTVNDNSSGTAITKSNVAFIVFSTGENLCNQTGSAAGASFTIPVVGQATACIPAAGAAVEYDDIVLYTDIDKMRAQACSSFRVTTESLPSGTEESAYPAVTLEGTDGTVPYVWTIAGGALPPGLALAAGGAITGTPTIDGSFNFTTQVADSDTPSRVATKSLTITINPNKPRITTEILSYGQVGANYAASLSATGGLAPYAWSASALPAGLSLQTAGACGSLSCSASSPCICGIPTTAGTYSFTATADDSRYAGGARPDRRATKNLSIAVNAGAGLSCTLTANPSSMGSAGAVSLVWAVNGGPATSGTWTPAPGGTCPTNVTGSGGNCTTGSVAGTTTFTLNIATAQGTTSCSASVIIGASSQTPTCTLAATPGTVVSGTPTVLSAAITNGPANGTWLASPGGTCTNFNNLGSYSCTTANIAAATTYQLSVYNISGFSTCSATVATCPVLTNNTLIPLAAGTLNKPGYSQNITYTGGTAPFTCSIPTGSLPPGLTLAGCTISGIPADAGTYAFTSRVTDSCGTPRISDRATSIIIANCSAGYALRNMTGANRWYKRNSGACTLWSNNADISVTPADIYDIHTNVACTALCATTNYSSQQVFDINSNCLTRMNSTCVFADR